MNQPYIARVFALALALALPLQGGRAEERFRAGISAGTSIPISDFGKFFSTGVAGTAQFAYELNPGVFVTASGGYSRWEVDNGAVNNAIIPVIGIPDVSLAIDGALRSVPVMIGVRYSPMLKGIQPYLALEAGLHLLQLDLSGTVTTGPNVTPLPSASDSWSEFGLAAGLGVDLPVARRWTVGISATYISVEKADIQITGPSDPTSTDISAQALRSYAIQAGVTYAF